MKVPFFGNDRQFKNLEDIIHETSKRVWLTGQYLNGPDISHFEESLAKFTNRRFALTLGSCTDALTYALLALKLPAGSEVLVTNFSFLSSATAILKAGLKPIFCDIDPETMMVTSQIFQESITPKTKAILSVSLFGSLTDCENIESLCKERGVSLIEDAAQSFGAKRSGRMAASFGEASAISFDPTKLLHGTGAGGALLTDNEELYLFAKSLRLHGRDERGNFIRLGDKSLLSSHDGAIMNEKLKLLPMWIKRRQDIAKRYTSALKESKILKTQHIPNDVHSTFHKFVILCNSQESRDALKNHLKEKDILTRIHYPKTISEEELFKEANAITPIAYEQTKRVLTLPLFQELTDEEVEYVCAALAEF